MSPERMRKIAQDVCDYADAHGYPRDKDVDEIVEDMQYVMKFKCPELLIYLYDFIDCDYGKVFDEIEEIVDAVQLR